MATIFFLFNYKSTNLQSAAYNFILVQQTLLSHIFITHNSSQLSTFNSSLSSTGEIPTGIPQFFSPEVAAANRATEAATMPFLSPAMQSFDPSQQGNRQASQIMSGYQQNEANRMGPASATIPMIPQSYTLPQRANYSPTPPLESSNSSSGSSSGSPSPIPWETTRVTPGTFSRSPLDASLPEESGFRVPEEEEIPTETLIEFLRNEYGRNRYGRRNPRVRHNRDGTSSVSLDTRALRRHLHLPGRRQSENERVGSPQTLGDFLYSHRRQTSWRNAIQSQYFNEEAQHEPAINQAERGANIPPPAASNASPSVMVAPAETTVLSIRPASERPRYYALPFI